VEVSIGGLNGFHQTLLRASHYANADQAQDQMWFCRHKYSAPADDIHYGALVGKCLHLEEKCN
jgi:hypothetical protein